MINSWRSLEAQIASAVPRSYRVLTYIFFINYFGIEFVFCDVYLTRFGFTKDLSFDDFLIFCTNCVVVITEDLKSNNFSL